MFFRKKRDDEVKVKETQAQTKETEVKSKSYNYKCQKCGAKLYPFHYYRDNSCSTYCQKCGKPSNAPYAAPNRTIELYFNGIQREGISLTVEIEGYPSFNKTYLRFYEWSYGGGADEKVHIPANYIPNHTAKDFMRDYVLTTNKATKQLSLKDNQRLLDQIENQLQDSGLFIK